jgi:NAD(P)-dependent dehydrogenase (short-subunit alcohol dehydrogenase family)
MPAVLSFAQKKAMKTLQNKIALVTGGNSGIGYAAARVLAERGATVVITGRRREAVETAARELGVFGFTADQAVLEDTDALVQYIREQFGRLDILFINAGIAGGGSNIENTTAEYFDTMMNINFRGAYFTLNRFIPLLPEGASVVFLSSIVAQMYAPQSSVYQASKAALNSIAKTAAAELATRKIRVNIVSPGPTRTEVLNKSGLSEAQLQQVFDHLTERIPLKKIGTADDVAGLVAYLSEDQAGFITGSEFVIDGGLTL